MPVTIGSNLVTTQPYIPLITQPEKVAGVDFMVVDAAALAALNTQCLLVNQVVRLASDNSLWKWNTITFEYIGKAVVVKDAPDTTATITSTLPATALGSITAYNSADAGVLSLPNAATAWAANPYGLVVVSQQGVGAATFAASGSDIFRATTGIAAASVRYGMIAAQIISSTEWAQA